VDFLNVNKLREFFDDFFESIYEFERHEDNAFKIGNNDTLLEEARRSERVKAYDKLIDLKIEEYVCN